MGHNVVLLFIVSVKSRKCGTFSRSIYVMSLEGCLPAAPEFLQRGEGSEAGLLHHLLSLLGKGVYVAGKKWYLHQNTTGGL